MSIATLAGSGGSDGSVSRTSIPADRARSLARWNRALVALHGIQFAVMIAIAGTATRFEPFVPTVKPILEDGRFLGVEETSVQLLSMPLAWFIASFLAMSAIAHWVEYAFSSTVMIVAIAYLSYIRDVPALVAIAGCNVAMNLFGWSMEAANEGRHDRPDWKHYIFGCIAGIMPWIGIFSILLAYGAQEGLPEGARIPAFVYVIVGTLFVTFNVFAITMVLQFKKIGRWRDYLVGEKTYMVMSLVAKSLLAWQVFSGTLRPGS